VLGYRNDISSNGRFYKRVYYYPYESEPTAERIFSDIENRQFRSNGYPTSITTDRGKQFTSSFWEGKLQSLSIEQQMATKGRAECNGQAERSIQSLLQYLRLFWDRLKPLSQILKDAEFANNNSQNKSTGYSPFYIETGTHPKFLDYRELVTGEDVDQIQAKARGNILTAQERMSIYYNKKKRKQEDFRKGEYIWLNTKNMYPGFSRNKLDPRYLGLFRIISRTSLNTYALELPDEWKRIHNNFHVSLIRKNFDRHAGEGVEGE
jgi:transposase InsO family protein